MNCSKLHELPEGINGCNSNHGVLIVNISANVPEEHTSCADHYFSELDGDNIPLNAMGSCGYIAPAMLLTYYDMYCNDDFAHEKYEQDVTYNSITNLKVI